MVFCPLALQENGRSDPQATAKSTIIKGSRTNTDTHTHRQTHRYTQYRSEFVSAAPGLFQSYAIDCTSCECPVLLHAHDLLTLTLLDPLGYYYAFYILHNTFAYSFAVKSQNTTAKHKVQRQITKHCINLCR